MLTDDLLKTRYADHLDDLILLAEKELERTKPEPQYHRLAEMYHNRFLSLRHTGAATRATGERLPSPARSGRARW